MLSEILIILLQWRLIHFKIHLIRKSQIKRKQQYLEKKKKRFDFGFMCFIIIIIIIIDYYALKYVPRYGFSNKTFLEALKNLDIPANSVLQLFPRGFAAALTEYIVKSSNFETQKQLEEKFSKDTFLNTIAENRDSFLQNQLRVPTITDVVEAALMVKVNYLTPFVDKWAEAVSCEISPSNLPYTIINLAEFADIAAYHMERVEQLHRLKPVLQIFANVQSTREKPKEQFLEAIRESIRGIPLSSGPHSTNCCRLWNFDGFTHGRSFIIPFRHSSISEGVIQNGILTPYNSFIATKIAFAASTVSETVTKLSRYNEEKDARSIFPSLKKNAVIAFWRHCGPWWHFSTLSAELTHTTTTFIFLTSSRMLPPTNSFASVLLRPSFAVPYSSTTTLFILLSYFLEKQTYEGLGKISFVSPNLFLNVLSYTSCVASMVYFGSAQFTRLVAEGHCPPIALEKLRALPYPFCMMCGYEGDRNLASFVFQLLFVPGVVVTLALHALSFVCGASLWEWDLPLDMYLASSSLWRLVVISVIYTINFLAAMNPTQSLLKQTEEKKEEKDEDKAEEKVKEDKKEK
eukprot:gene8991-6313_t